MSLSFGTRIFKIVHSEPVLPLPLRPQLTKLSTNIQADRQRQISAMLELMEAGVQGVPRHTQYLALHLVKIKSTIPTPIKAADTIQKLCFEASDYLIKMS